MKRSKKFKVDKRKFLKNIIDGDLAGVKIFLEKYPVEKYVYNHEDESAVASSLNSRQFKVYEVLISHKLWFGPHEDFDIIFMSMTDPERVKIRAIHKKCAIPIKPDHLMTLISKSHLFDTTRPSEKEKRELRELVDKAFEDINEIEWIEPVLRVVANAPKLKISFDFQQDSVYPMDPTQDSDTQGLCYHDRGDIYIGAKELVDKKSRFEVLGVMAHEMCHYAIQLTYNNKCKPYKENDGVKTKEFGEVFDSCPRDVEPIIDIVFRYRQSSQTAELIVRVPHILALYKNRKGKITQLRNHFNDLFKFFENNTLIDLKREFPLLEAKKSICSLNELLGVASELNKSTFILSEKALQSFQVDLKKTDEILCVRSNCPQLTMTAIYNKLKIENDFEYSYVFAKIETFKIDTIFQLLVSKDFKHSREPAVIIDCSAIKQNDVEEVLLELKDSLNNVKISVVTTDSVILDLSTEITTQQLFHSWSQLSPEAQHELFKLEIIFQGEKIYLEYFATSELLEILPLNDLITSQEIKVGSKIEFSEFELHVERKLFFYPLKINGLQKFDEYSVNELLDIVELRGKAVLLSGEPGVGKTTEFKIMTRKLKEKFPTRWIIYADLKHFDKTYKKDDQTMEPFQNSQQVSYFIGKNILNVESFELQLFYKFFEKGRVVFLADGFDEISPNFKKFVLNLLIAINETKNQLWISTRPHLADELKNELDADEYRFQEFTNENEIEFFKRIIISKNIKDGKINQILKKIQDFLDSFWKRSQCTAYFSSPLLMKMIATLIIDSEIKENEQSNLLNYYTIYEQFVDSIINDFMNKGAVAKMDQKFFMTCSSLNILEFHQKIALQIIYADHIVLNDLVDKFFRSSDLSIERMVRVGLLKSDSPDHVYFAHKTFAEFFVADFLIKIFFLSPEDIEPRFYELLDIVFKRNQGSYQMVITFFDNAIEANELNEKPERLERLEKLKNRSAYFLKIFDDRYNSYHFHELASVRCINLMKVISTVLTEKTLVTQLWMESDDSENSILISATKSSSLIFFKKFWILAEQILPCDKRKQLFCRRNKDSETIFHLVVETGEPEMFRFLSEKAKLVLSKEEIRELISIDDYKILTSSDRDSENPILNVVLEIIEQNFDEAELKIILKSYYVNRGTLLHQVCEVNYSEDLNRFCKFLKEKLTDPHELKQLVLEKKREDYKNGCTALMMATENRKEKSFEVFWEFFTDLFSEREDQIKALLEEDSNGMLVVHRAIIGFGLTETIHYVIGLYIEMVGIEKVKEIIMKKTETYEVFLFSVLNQLYLNENIRIFWDYMQIWFEPDELKMILCTNNHMATIIQNVIKDGTDNGEKVIKTFLPFFLKNFTIIELMNINFFHLICHAAVNWTFEFFENLYSNDENYVFVSQLFTMTFDEDRNIFFFAVCNRNVEIFNSLIDTHKAKCLLSVSKLSDMLSSRDKNGHDILFYLLKTIKEGSKSCIFSYKILTTLEENLETERFKEVLKRLDKENKTVLYYATQNCDSYQLRNVCEVLEKYLNDKDLQEAYKSSSETLTGANVLIFAAQNPHSNVFEVFWGFFERVFSVELHKKILKAKDQNFDFAILKIRLDDSRAIYKWYSENDDRERFTFILELYKKSFDNIELQTIFLNQNIDDETIIYACKNTRALKSLWCSIESTLGKDDKKNLLVKRNKKGQTCFDKAKENNRFDEVLDVFLPFLINAFTIEECRDNALLSILFLACKTCSFDFFERNFSGDDGENFLKKFYYEKSEDGRNLFHFAASNSGSFQFFFKKIKTLFLNNFHEFLTQTDQAGNNILFYSLYSPRYILYNPESLSVFEFVLQLLEVNMKPNYEKELKLMLTTQNQEGSTILHRVCVFYDSVSLTKVFRAYEKNLSQNELEVVHFQTLKKNGEIPLMIVAENFKQNSFENAWRFVDEKFSIETKKKLLSIANKRGLTVFDCTVLGQNGSNFSFYNILYESVFGYEELLKIILRANSTGENILFYLTEKYVYPDNNFGEDLWNYLKELFDIETLMKLLAKRNSSGKLFVHRAIELRSIERILKIFMPFIFNNFIENEVYSNNLLLMMLDSFCHCSENFLSDIFKSENSSSYFKSLYTFRDETGNNIFQLSLEHKSQNAINILMESADQLLTHDELKNECLKILHYSALLSIEKTKEMLKILKKYLTADELKLLFKSKDDDLTNFVHYACFNSNFYGYRNNFDAFWNFLKDQIQIDEDTQKSVLLQEDRFGQTPFHYTVMCQLADSVNRVLNVYLRLFGIEVVKEQMLKVNIQGETIFHLALSNRSQFSVSLLERKVARMISTPYFEARNQIVDVLWEMVKTFDIINVKELLFKRDHNEETFFDILKKEPKYSTPSSIIEFAEKKFTPNEMNEHGLSPISCILPKNCFVDFIDQLPCGNSLELKLLKEPLNEQNKCCLFQLIFRNKHNEVIDLYLSKAKFLLSKNEFDENHFFLNNTITLTLISDGIYVDVLNIIKGLIPEIDMEKLKKQKYKILRGAPTQANTTK